MNNDQGFARIALIVINILGNSNFRCNILNLLRNNVNHLK